MKASKEKSKSGKSSRQPIQKKKVKLQKKKSAFRSKLKISHDAISEKKSQQQKKSRKNSKRKSRSSHSLNTMKSLADTLSDFSAEYTGSRDLTMKVNQVTTSKQRDKIMKEERSRMSEVLHHPVFVANPLGAIMSHLEATLPTPSGNSGMKH